MAFGLKPVKMRGAQYNNGGMETFPVANAYGTALFRGDPVKLSAGYLQIAGNGDKVLGVFWGASYVDANGVPQAARHLPASTAANGAPYDQVDGLGLEVNVAKVITQRDVLMEIQADNSVSVGLVGRNFRVSIGTGNTTTGLSGANLKVSSATTSGGDAASASSQTMVRLVGVADRPGNSIGASNPILLVRWNYHMDDYTNV